MDEDNNNGLRPDDMQESMQTGMNQGKKIAGKVGTITKNKVKNLATKGKKFKGAKTLGNKPGEKVGLGAKLKGRALQKAGAAEKAVGNSLKVAGLGTQATGMGLKGTGAGLKAAGTAMSLIPYVGTAIGNVLKTAGESISKAGSQVDKTGKKIKKKGTERSKAGENKIKRGQQLEQTGKDVGEKGGAKAGGAIPGMPNVGNLSKPNPSALKSQALSGLFKKRMKLVIIVIGIVLIVLILFTVLRKKSKDNSAGYSEGDLSNTPYVVSSMVMNQITIVKDSSGNYIYAFQDEDGNILTLDEALDNALTTLGENSSTTLSDLGEDDDERKDLLKQMIQAEITTQYPTLKDSEDLGYTAVPTATSTSVAGCDTNLDVTEEKNFITDLDKLKTALGSYNSTLESHASDFLEFQEQYKINAVFVAAVSVWETGGGTVGNATNGCNNWGNIDSKEDPLAGGNYKAVETSEGVHNWAIYPDAKTGIEAIYSLIASRGPYVSTGNKTLSQIFLVYNPGDSSEAGKVANSMASMYSAAGISSVTAGTSTGAGTSLGTKTGEKTTNKEIKKDNTFTGGIQIQRKDENGEVINLKYTSTDNFDALITQNSDEALNYYTLKRKVNSSGGAADGSTSATITSGTEITVPDSLGDVHTYMGWSKITAPSSMQYKLREQAGENYDSEGFAKINGRYVIACTTTYGQIGDYLDFYQEDGSIIKCIMGDAKNQTDAGCNKWGHNDGTCIVEFVVQTDIWYNEHENPGTSTCHPEWSQQITKVVNGGSYFENPTFGEDDIKSNGTSSDGTSSDGSDSDSPIQNTNDLATLTLVTASKTIKTITETTEYQYTSSSAINTTSGSGAPAEKKTDTPANTTSSVTTITYKATSVNYQKALKNYTLYFDFLWAILVDSDANFVKDWIELATKDLDDGNKITITVYSDENQSSTSAVDDSATIEKSSYDESSKVYTRDVYNKTTTTTTSINTITSKPVVTYADTWLLDYENNADNYDEYKGKSKEKITEKVDPNSSDDNIIKLLQKSPDRLSGLYNDKYIIDGVLENNEKVSFMIDIYQYILDIAKGKKIVDSDIPQIISETMSASTFDLTTFVPTSDLSGPGTASGDGATGGIENGTGGDGYTTTFSVGSRTYKNYKQQEGSYAGDSLACFENDTIASAGCAITSIAVIASGYGIDMSPGDVNAFCKTSGNGSNHALNLSAILGKSVTNHNEGDFKQMIIDQLSAGKPCMVRSSYYSYSHYFCILAISEDGQQVYVSDVGGNYVGQDRNGWQPISFLDRVNLQVFTIDD